MLGGGVAVFLGLLASPQLGHWGPGETQMLSLFSKLLSKVGGGGMGEATRRSRGAPRVS